LDRPKREPPASRQSARLLASRAVCRLPLFRHKLTAHEASRQLEESIWLFCMCVLGEAFAANNLRPSAQRSYSKKPDPRKSAVMADCPNVVIDGMGRCEWCLESVIGSGLALPKRVALLPQAFSESAIGFSRFDGQLAMENPKTCERHCKLSTGKNWLQFRLIVRF